MSSHINIAEMTLPERLTAMEELWTSLRNTDSEIPSPDWHGEVLRHRKALVESGEAKFLSLDELRKRLGLSD